MYYGICPALTPVVPPGGVPSAGLATASGRLHVAHGTDRRFADLVARVEPGESSLGVHAAEVHLPRVVQVVGLTGDVGARLGRPVPAGRRAPAEIRRAKYL